MSRDDVATEILHRVIAREGNIADIGDGAGETRFGQTPRWLKAFGFGPPANFHEALANYRTWLVRTRLIGLCDLPDALADMTIDFAVNAGHPVAIGALQRALGLHVDNIYGPETQAAVDACDRTLAALGVFAGRMVYRGQIITGNPLKHARWARAWFSRDAEQLLALAKGLRHA